MGNTLKQLKTQSISQMTNGELSKLKLELELVKLELETEEKRREYEKRAIASQIYRCELLTYFNYKNGCVDQFELRKMAQQALLNEASHNFIKPTSITPINYLEDICENSHRFIIPWFIEGDYCLNSILPEKDE